MSVFSVMNNMTRAVVERMEQREMAQNGVKLESWLNVKTFQQIFGANVRLDVYREICKQIEQAGCKTREQQAMFLAQCATETGGFRVFVENLNYSADSLLRVFPKYFNERNVSLYARNPQGIANRCYANRMGNGSEQSGDGWKYRGRGLIQITGKSNYIIFADWAKLPSLVSNPDQITQSAGLIVSVAVWYWVRHKLADYGSDVLTVTKKINGGTHGLTQRQNYFKRLMAL